MTKALVRNANGLALIAIVLLVGIIGLITWLQFTGTRDARFWVGHTYEVIITADKLGTALRDAETNQRGYLLTQQEDYLAPYRSALERVTLLQGELRRLTADNAAQQDRLQTLASLIQRKQEEMAETIQHRRDVGLEAGDRWYAGRSSVDG